MTGEVKGKIIKSETKSASSPGLKMANQMAHQMSSPSNLPYKKEEYNKNMLYILDILNDDKASISDKIDLIDEYYYSIQKEDCYILTDILKIFINGIRLINNVDIFKSIHKNMINIKQYKVKLEINAIIRQKIAASNDVGSYISREFNNFLFICQNTILTEKIIDMSIDLIPFLKDNNILKLIDIADEQIEFYKCRLLSYIISYPGINYEIFEKVESIIKTIDSKNFLRDFVYDCMQYDFSRNLGYKNAILRIVEDINHREYLSNSNHRPNLLILQFPQLEEEAYKKAENNLSMKELRDPQSILRSYFEAIDIPTDLHDAYARAIGELVNRKLSKDATPVAVSENGRPAANQTSVFPTGQVSLGLSDEDMVFLKQYAAKRQWVNRLELGYPWQMSPVVFIRNQYSEWIDKGMTRVQLRIIDEQLCQRLEAWLCEDGNSIPANFVPTRGEVTDAIAMSIGLSPDVIKAAARVQNRESKRAYRAKIKASLVKEP